MLKFLDNVKKDNKVSSIRKIIHWNDTSLDHYSGVIVIVQKW